MEDSDEVQGAQAVRGLLGEKVSPPSEASIHECCYPQGPPEFFDVTLIDHGNPVGGDVKFEAVEKSFGLLPTLRSRHFRWDPERLLLDEDAAAVVRKFFPNVVFTANVTVVIGHLVIDASEDLGDRDHHTHDHSFHNMHAQPQQGHDHHSPQQQQHDRNHSLKQQQPDNGIDSDETTDGEEEEQWFSKQQLSRQQH